MSKNIWTTEECMYLEKNKDILTVEQMCKALNKTSRMVNTKIRNLEMSETTKKENGIWTEQEINFLEKNYKKLTNNELSKKLNRTNKAISIKLKRLNLKREDLYNYNKSFFSNIDTEEKAYWLGFIYADGYVVYSPQKRNYELGIEIAVKDIEHLKKFNKAISGNIKPTIRKKNACGIVAEMCNIRLYSKEIVENLMSLNILPNKTYKKQFPILDDIFFIPFIRGYFDGDGCVCYNKKKLRYDFTSVNYDILEYIRSKLYSEYNIYSYISTTEKGVGNQYITSKVDYHKLIIGGVNNGKNFANLIYNGANIYLDRKYKKAQNDWTDFCPSI